MATILWLSNETPDPAGQGGQRRQFFQVRELARAGHQVTLVTLDGPQDDTTVSRFARVGRTRSHWRGKVRRPGHKLLLRRLAREHWDAVVLAHTESWPTFRSVIRDTAAPTWVDLHNVLGHDIHGQRTGWADIEQEIIGSASMVSVCSEPERVRLLDQQPRAAANTRVMTHGVDPAEWQAVRTRSVHPVVKLFGNWGWEPNMRGLHWFLNEVWPALEVPAARCEIAGSGVTIDEGTPSGVSFVGRVPALDEWTSDAWAVAVPVMGGVGAPVKYLEALATGAPVLSTIDGAPSAQEAAALVSDASQEWVTVLRSILTSPVGSGDRRVPAEDFSWKNATVPLLDWLEAL